MPVDFRYAWHFATRAYPCHVQWASDTEMLARWRAGWLARQPGRYPAPERPLLAVGWRDDSGMHIRLAQSRTSHERLGDALLSMVNWLMLLAPNSQICAQENDTGGEPLVTEQRPCYGPLPRATHTFLEVTPPIDSAHAP